MSEQRVRLLRRRLRKLQFENNRLREVVEAFASRSLFQTESPHRTNSETTLVVLEKFDESPPPKINTRIRDYGGFSASTVNRDNVWFPTIMGRLNSLDPSPGWRCMTAHQAEIRLGFNLIGADLSRIEEAVRKIEERQLRDRDFLPVFITDSTDFEVFRLRGYTFEYIPAAITRAPKNRRAERRYLKQRLQLIVAKWDLDNVVDLSGG